jgi:dolichol-phosphate mannosyltransferase
MFSTEAWPQPAVRLWTLAQRFQKFLLVGAFGLAVNQAMLYLLRDVLHLRLLVASPLAILISMLVTFVLNEIWTWHDRGSGRIATRAVLYHLVNSGGLLINTGVLWLLVEHGAVHYLLANLVGAAMAAVWNFAVNNAVTWRA